jgi:hypothetical protein
MSWRWTGLAIALALFELAITSCVGEEPGFVGSASDSDGGAVGQLDGSTNAEAAAAVEDAGTAESSTFDAGCSGAVACERVVFATQSTKTGGLGGASAADAFCTAEANAAGAHGRVRGREFVAWVSVVAAQAAERHVHGTGGYVRPDGAVVASSWVALVDGTLDAPVAIDQFGAAVGGSAWTGTEPDGTRASGNCVDFASSSQTDVGAGGALDAVDAKWSASASFYCNSARHLICIEK